jgi:hypothetical protein
VSRITVSVQLNQHVNVRGHQLDSYGTQHTTASRIQICKREAYQSCKSSGPFLQGCGSGLDPDSETVWIRIRIGNPDPDPGARKLRNFSGKMHFLVIF